MALTWCYLGLTLADVRREGSNSSRRSREDPGGGVHRNRLVLAASAGFFRGNAIILPPRALGPLGTFSACKKR